MFKKNIISLACLLLLASSVVGQVFNNEWINYSLQYYKIKIGKDGLYRIDSATLANAGVPLGTFKTQNIQLFHKGKEIAPYIMGEADSVLNASDYILFYATRNTGKDDSLYFDPYASFITNPFYSVISDTAAVFFTWNTQFNNKRLVPDTDTNYSKHNASPYYYKEFLSDLVWGWWWYSPGPMNYLNLADPRYETGEGVYVYQISETVSYAIGLNTSAVYTGGPQAYFNICYSGANDIALVNPDHIIQAYYTDNAGNPVYLNSDSISGYATHKYNFTLNPSLFGTSATVGVTSLVNPNTSISNITNVNYIYGLVPYQFNLLGGSEERINLPYDGQDTTKLVISSFNGARPYLVNLTDNKLHTVTASGGNFLALIQQTAGQSKLCYLADSLSVRAITTITPVNGNARFIDYTAGVKDSNYLLVYHPSLDADSSVTKYKLYRSSLAGGNHSVIMAPVTDLYDQFGLGVEISPMSIRNFCAWVIANPAADPKNLFLMGKSVHSVDCVVGSNGPPPSWYKDKNLVPSWGNPSSDVLITQGLPGSTYLEPAIPTGRLSAQTPQDVAWYLSKVMLYEQQTDDSLWKKRALHFVGGKDYYEQQTLTYYTNNYRAQFEDTSMGGEVYSFYKLTTAPTSITTNDSVKKLIEDGVLLMTFFGHGSQTGFDQNIDDPQNYNNSPKFPLIIGNSCYTGDLHSADQLSNSEVFTLAHNNKGSIGFLATVSEGIANYLFYYTLEFYKQFGAKMYGRSYAACLKKGMWQLTYDELHGMYPGSDSLLRWTIMEMTFHGDPAIAPYTTLKPDYTVKNSDVILEPNVQEDSISVKIIMTNLAKAVCDSFTVQVQRTFPNGDVDKIYKRVKAPYYMDTLSFKVQMHYTSAVGYNCFDVELDYLHQVAELNENNNKTSSVCTFIPGADIEPVWPYKFAIVPDIQKVTLKASTADPFAPMTTYRFQVDTNNKFQSKIVNTTVTAPGGVVTLSVPNLYNKDSVVYYWRVCKDDNDTLNWKESSFQVITGKYGWAQAHFNQFRDDSYQYVVYWDSTPSRQFKFVNDVKDLVVTDFTWAAPFASDWTQVAFYYNNAQQRAWSCEPNGWTVAVFDSITGNLVWSDTLGVKGPSGWMGSNGNCICDPGSAMAFDFGNYSFCYDVPDWRTNMTNFINDSIPVGAPVLAWTVKGYGLWTGNPNTPQTGQDTMTVGLINALKSIGSTMVDSLADSTSLIIFGRKGMAPGQAHEVISHQLHEHITLHDSINTHYRNGYIASAVIGPCMFTDSAWHSLHWNYRSLESNSADSIVVHLVGITATGFRVDLADFPADSLNVLDLSNYAHGTQYPYLQLIAYEADKTINTPPQLIKWQVIYDPAPEAAIDPPSGFQVFKAQVAEGEDYKVRLPIRNISEFPFNDSLVVTYINEDANRVNDTLPYTLKKKPFLPDSIIFDTITIATLGKPGSNVLWVDVNPPRHKKYQPEQYHFNNVAQISYNVDKDRINPLLDVTFDGIHILNGDIVSAKPNILIGLKDENKFLALNDTGNFMVYVTYPGSSTETRLFFKDVLQFTPAQMPNNSCKINYKPALVQDGIYTLRVAATDRSKNISGQIDYKIQFEIVNKPTITEVLNYPNPFSTSTRFVFTITGSEIPETFKIQVMTITGRVVKEITREELGFIHIGRNITEYAWDGTDQFGDKLANGVYLYHVDTRLNGNEIEHKTTEADGYFKKGFGKMLLMR